MQGTWVGSLVEEVPHTAWQKKKKKKIHKDFIKCKKKRYIKTLLTLKKKIM